MGENICQWLEAFLDEHALPERNCRTNFCTDGRARSLLEAVLWHGGEAEPAKNKVKAMSASNRVALVKFLESL